MKKYCLTDCAKQKLSKGKEAIIGVIVVIGIILVVGFGVLALVAILGLSGEWIITTFELDYKLGEHFMQTGAGLLGLSILMLLFIRLSFMFITWLYKVFKGIVTNQFNKYQGNDYEKCKIFEECKDEKL